jgi:hypothetical protein
MKATTAVLVALLAGCGVTKSEAPGGPGGPDASAAGARDAGPDGLDDVARAEASAPDAGAADVLVLPASCAGGTVPPTSLVCTGLYADIATKTIAPGLRAYAPAVPLWSDGASKQRWISLPAGQKIDNSTADEWLFPVGTKVWKEFSKDGKRVETRLWQKVSVGYWVDATYAWNADESVATRSDGGDIPFGTGTYHIPTSDECTKCHRGRIDHILGFDQVLLGLAGATGFTLDELIAEGRLTNPPAKTPLVIGDDGTNLAAPALAWLHVNCGTTCHNRNSNATAWSTGMFLRLDPTQLDGRSVKGFDSLTTTIGVAAVTVDWKGRTRIVPHDPASSLLYQLISHRGTGNQMPPIASSVVDEADIPLVEAWIEQLPVATTTPDGGAPDAGRDATESGAPPDGGTEAASDDAPAVDAGASDAAPPDVLDAAPDVAAVDLAIFDAPLDVPADVPDDTLVAD